MLFRQLAQAVARSPRALGANYRPLLSDIRDIGFRASSKSPPGPTSGPWYSQLGSPSTEEHAKRSAQHVCVPSIG